MPPCTKFMPLIWTCVPMVPELGLRFEMTAVTAMSDYVRRARQRRCGRIRHDVEVPRRPVFVFERVHVVSHEASHWDVKLVGHVHETGLDDGHDIREGRCGRIREVGENCV